MHDNAKDELCKLEVIRQLVEKLSIRIKGWDAGGNFRENCIQRLLYIR